MDRVHTKSITKILVLTLCLALIIALAIAVSAATEPTVIYLDGTNGLDTNDGTTQATAVKTLTTAYAKLLAVTDGVATNASAKGIIVLCGPTPIGGSSDNFNIPSSGKATYAHVGTITMTSKYGSVDATATASLKATKSSLLYFQLGGPTVYENMTIDVSAQQLCIYAADNFTITETVTVTGCSDATKFMIQPGYCRVDATGTVTLNINGGTVGTIASATWSASHKNATGTVKINIGGNANVSNVYAGAGQAENVSISDVTVTVSDEATVGTYFTGGGNGTIANSTLVLAGGTVSAISQNTNVTNTNLTISGVTGTFTMPSGTWSKLTITGNSNVDVAAELPAATALVVDSGSVVRLAIGDDHTYTGEGTVVYDHTHDWKQDPDHTNVPASCTTSGTNYYKCVCGKTRTETINPTHSFENGTCTICGAIRNVVYVSANGTGDGYDVNNPASTLEQAYATLLAVDDGIKTNAAATATIVIAGPYLYEGSFNADGNCDHVGTVTITSVHDNVDYRENGAALHIRSLHTGTTSTHGTTCEQRFHIGGPTVMDNLDIDRNESKQPLTIYAGYSLEIKDTVRTLNTNFDYSKGTDPLPGLTQSQIDTMLLSAHRGYQPMGPENSILSFTAAGQLGFDYIETDVYMTTDGELVCIHDSTLDRTTNGSGSVTSKSYTEIKTYKIDTAGYGYNIADADPSKLYVPTFREYLEICAQYDCKPFIELKDYRENVIHAIIDMALEYFDAEDIVMSCGSLAALQTSYDYNKDVFHHLIWGDQSDAGYTNSISVLSNFKNTAGDVYAGIAFNITNLDVAANYASADSWIKKANAASLQTCLRGADNMTQVRLMFDLGIDYYPTNTTYPEKLQDLLKGVPGTDPTYVSNGLNVKGTNDRRIFIRGGSGSGATTEDIYLTIMGGQYDFVAPSNAEQASGGDYNVTVGGKTYISRFICGETHNKDTATHDNSIITLKDEAVIAEFYLAGDTGHVENLTVNFESGVIKKIISRRSGKTGTVKDFTFNVADPDMYPNSVALNAEIITGTKKLNLSGVGSIGNCTEWDSIVAQNGAVVTLAGEYTAANLSRVGTGKFLVNDQSVVFGTIEQIKEDGAVVVPGVDVPYTTSEGAQPIFTWYKDVNGIRGAKLSEAPSVAGTYWIGISLPEVATDNEIIYRTALETAYATFTITHDLTHVPADPSDCTTDGNVEYWHCEGCGKNFADENATQVLPDVTDEKDGHSMTRFPADPSDCTTDGNVEYWHCSTCEKNFANEDGTNELTSVVDEADGHDMTHHDAAPSNCTEDGTVEYWSCGTCNKNFADEAGATELDSIVDTADGHDMTHHAADPSNCTEDGTVEYWSCGTCNKNFADEAGTTVLDSIVDTADGHDMTHHAADPSNCTEDGTVEYWSCGTCNKNFADEAGTTELDSIVDTADGHDMTHHDAVPSDCTEDGTVEYWSCDVCDKNFADEAGTTELDSIVDTADGHDLTKVDEVPATADKAGKEEHWVCDECDKLFSDAEGETEVEEADLVIPALGHEVETEVETGVVIEGLENAVHGESYTFTVELEEGYVKGENFKVMVNGKELKANADGSYTIVSVTGKLEISVTGAVKQNIIPDTGDNSLIVAMGVLAVLTTTMAAVLISNKKYFF